MSTKRKISSIVVAASVVGAAGCSSTSTSVPPAAKPAGTQRPDTGTSFLRSANGHSEEAVLAQIAQARQAGQSIRYASVRTKSREYVFPPNAQIVRTDGLLVVRAYKRLYAWKLDTVSVDYAGQSAIDVSTIPHVHAPDLDAKAAAARSGRSSPVSADVAKLCGDCAVILWRPEKAVFPDPWANLHDPWQTSSDWAIVHPDGSQRQARFVTYGSGCDPGWTCYYGWYPTWYPPDNGQGGGGGSATGPAPNPPCQGTSATDAEARDKAAGNALKAANQATPDVFNDIGSDTNAPNGKEAHGYIYSDGAGGFSWDSSAVSNLDANGRTTIPPANPPAGWTTIGQWHTHPHQPSPADPTQTENGLHFSRTDIDLATTSSWIMYVGVLDTLSSTDLNESPQKRWYRYDPNGRSETLKNTVGAGGC